MMLISALVGLLGMVGEPLPKLFNANETVLFQGDSITDGNRGRSADPNHILGHGFVFSIASAYGEEYPEQNLNFVNRGVSGNTIDDLRTRWKEDTLALKPAVLSILIGINDIGAARSQGKALDSKNLLEVYDQLLAETRQAKPNVRFVLCAPFVLNVGGVAKNPEGWRRDVEQVTEVVVKLAGKYQAPVVRWQKVFDDAVLRAPAEHWIWDGIHPTYSGHQLMAKEWIRAVNEFYVSPLRDPARNSAINPVVNFERDSYNWLHRHRDVLDAQKKTQADIVLIGDSITHFWGGEPKAGQANGPKAWAETFAGVKALNLGYGWDRTQNVLWRLQNGEFIAQKPKSIVLNIGTNNLVGDETARTNTPAEVAVGIEQIVDILHERAPEAQIFVMSVFPRGFEKGNALDKSITELNALVAKALAGRPKVTILDIGAKLREADGSVSQRIFSDGTHPTEAGYVIWGKALHEAGAIPKG